ncbi:MAG: M23 family metallopeptidase [Deltaproteobacteria bacterium]|nr:M23 family metallopeptidase [Deltaproteobacteria bacterium]
MSRGIVPVALAIALIAATPTPVAAARPGRLGRPWIARRPPVAPPPAHQLRDLTRWPAEPAEPSQIDPERFRQTVEHLCTRGLSKPAAKASSKVLSKTSKKSSGQIAASQPTATDEPVAVGPAKLGDLVQGAAAEAGVDPFLLAGLMFVQSGCRPSRESRRGAGLLRIHAAMYRSPGAPPAPGEADDWRLSTLLDPAENLRLGAKLLQMWGETHAEIDAAFGGVPHRGPVAHFIWGDVVRGSGAEDQVLTARRRMIAFYLETPEPTTKTSFGPSLVCPLEGAPRVASSGPGEDRAGGKRRHRGIDLVAVVGEPVRAVADGTVMFAGANLPGSARTSVPPSRIARYRWRRLGAGGIYVCIEHAPERHVVTCYMHLDTYSVSEGDAVAAGQIIGRVGRTGVQLSPPHLHFELRIDDRVVDPARHLSSLVIPPKATQTYRLVMKAKRLRVSKVRGAKAAGTAAAAPAEQKL